MKTDPENSILSEAQGLVHGDRNNDYGHPYLDYKRTTEIFKAWTGIELTPSQGAMFMVCVKLSRLGHKWKRDSVVDAAGYLEVLRMIQKEEQKPMKKQINPPE